MNRLPDCEQAQLKTTPERLEYTGNVECELPDGAKLFADEVFVYLMEDRARIVATGNVVFDGPEGHISSARMDYDTSTGTGTFEQASGFLAHPGMSDVLAGSPSVVYFYGERLERVGPRKYRITKGRWSTCEQPTPRWDITSTSMILNLDDYVVARNTVLRVKRVPVFYWPYFYYPIQSDDRATGFLMPTYGRSTYRGQAISNQFFWAINRSQDATFMHDWFTSAGQGAGVEYRYAAAPQSSGTFRFYRFNSDEQTADDDAGTVTPARTSYEVNGSAVHTFAPGIVGRVRMDYFSDVVTQQLLHQNVYEASRRNRLIEGGVTAALGPVAMSALYQRNEAINSAVDTLVYGSTPRVTAAIAPQHLFDSPVYASLNAEYAYLPYRRLLDGVLTRDDSFARVDVAPSIRVPLSRLSFLSINTSASYRGTYYTRQAAAGGSADQTIDGPYLRQYANARADIVGPVLNRVWDLDESSTFAQRLKHVIEPAFTLDFTSGIRDYRRTPVLNDPSAFVVGGSTRVTYGLTNRLFARSGAGPGGRGGTTREFVTVGLQQTFYSEPEASRYDGTYVTAQGVGASRELSPVAMNVRVSPSSLVDANARLEYNVYGAGLQVLTTGATLNGSRNGLTLNYSRQQLDPSQPVNSFASASVRTKLMADRLSTSYAVSWDIARSYVVSHGVIGSYMAQCCGVQAEFQQFNYPAGSGIPIPTDRRINVSFVMSGIGTFSNFFGAFGGF